MVTIKYYLAIILLTISVSTFGQKFMVQGNDTLPYKDKLVVQTDTSYFGDKVYYPGDTLYEGTCQSFEKVNGKIINQTDNCCLRQGVWIITDSSGYYWTGIYHNGHEKGIWKWFDNKGKLLEETEKVNFAGDSYMVKEIDYSSGHPIIIVDRAFLKFYIDNIILIYVIIFGTFFSRPFINSRIYNIENGTNLSLLYFGLPFTKKYWKHASHSFLCLYTLWFFNYKPENRRLVIISNTFSAIALGTFFGLLIGLAINGELH